MLGAWSKQRTFLAARANCSIRQPIKSSFSHAQSDTRNVTSGFLLLSPCFLSSNPDRFHDRTWLKYGFYMKQLHSSKLLLYLRDRGVDRHMSLLPTTGDSFTISWLSSRARGVTYERKNVSVSTYTDARQCYSNGTARVHMPRAPVNRLNDHSTINIQHPIFRHISSERS